MDFSLRSSNTALKCKWVFPSSQKFGTKAAGSGGWAHLGVPAPAELQDHHLQVQTVMGKPNVCKYSVPEGPHQQEKQPPAVLAWTAFTASPESRTQGIHQHPQGLENSHFLSHSQFQIPNCLTGHLLPTIFGISWKTIQNHYQVLQLSLPFCRKYQNCENYTSWKI